MSTLQELINTANALSQRLEKAAIEEKTLCDDLRFRLELMSYEIFKTANELNEIKYYIG